MGGHIILTITVHVAIDTHPHKTPCNTLLYRKGFISQQQRCEGTARESLTLLLVLKGRGLHSSSLIIRECTWNRSQGTMFRVASRANKGQYFPSPDTFIMLYSSIEPILFLCLNTVVVISHY